ncbi:MAG: dihydrofolate reductase family protein, partial [Coxiellaceae bacterium]|nr:dihydrofolate reductase family protein [Coxiellaceae bacterium]
SATLLNNTKPVTLLHAKRACAKQQPYLERGIRCISLAESETGLDLSAVLLQLGQEGCHDVWVEAGSQFFNALIQEKKVQRALVYVAPTIAGEGLQAFPDGFDWISDAKSLSWYHHGPDAICELGFV